MSRNFQNWFETFRDSIATYDYYVDFEKVYRNVNEIRVELNILNSLIGSQNIEQEFLNLVRQYPQVLKCIPLLLAVREKEIQAMDSDGEYVYQFASPNYMLDQYCVLMRKTGLFGLISGHIISNLVDYVTGVETGLDSNGRKNRGGHLMENLVESYLLRAGMIRDITYFKEMETGEIAEKWGIDLSPISNQGRTKKRFDFLVKTPQHIYALETNFYKAGGSKLNETARSYKTLALEARAIPNFSFVWITDGKGWKDARHNLEETFDVLSHLYNIADLNNNIFSSLFV